jgi:hypothetical protein
LSENDNLFRVKDLPPKEKREQNNHPLMSETHTHTQSVLLPARLEIYSLGDVIECLSVEGSLGSLINHPEEVLAEFMTWRDWIIGK